MKKWLMLIIVVIVGATALVKLGVLSHESEEKVVEVGTISQEKVIEGFTQIKGYIPDDIGAKSGEFAKCTIEMSWKNLSDGAKESLARGSADGLSVGDAKALSSSTFTCLTKVK